MTKPFRPYWRITPKPFFLGALYAYLITAVCLAVLSNGSLRIEEPAFASGVNLPAMLQMLFLMFLPGLIYGIRMGVGKYIHTESVEEHENAAHAARARLP